MTEQEAQAHYNYLMTLCIRREEAFGPLAMAFIGDHDLDRLGLQPEEQLNLYMATADAFAAEPKRHTHKLECLRRALQILQRTQHTDPTLGQHLEEEIQKTSAELKIYNEAFKAVRRGASARSIDKQRIVVETDLPDYFLSVAQKRAAAYYRQKYHLTKEVRIGLNFKGPTRRFEPDNPSVHKDFAAACAPFMSARTTAFHLMLPFDLKISRKPDDPLEAGVRIWYAKTGYSFPLRYERGRLCSWYDDQGVDVGGDAPPLLFVSVSPVKERELGAVERPMPSDVPPEIGLPRSFLESTDALGSFLQIGCNFKVWFDANELSLLTQGAPDLHEYGLQGAVGLLTRTYATDKVHAYAQASGEPWQEGLSFNYVNMHLLLQPGIETAFVPFNTPIFSLSPVLNHQRVEIEDRRAL